MQFFRWSPRPTLTLPNLRNESDASSSTTEADALTKASNTLGDSASQPIILTDDEVPYPPETPGRSRVRVISLQFNTA